jgi:hypothetical protein
MRKPAANTVDRREQPDRPDRTTRRRGPAADADPESPAEEVDETRIDERHAREDVAVVEVPERGGERQHREQVEVAQREQAPPVGEPTRNAPQKSSQSHGVLIFLPPKAPFEPRAIFQATCGPVQASVTRPVLSFTRPIATSPALPDQAFTSHQRRSGWSSKLASVTSEARG